VVPCYSEIEPKAEIATEEAKVVVAVEKVSYLTEKGSLFEVRIEVVTKEGVEKWPDFESYFVEVASYYSEVETKAGVGMSSSSLTGNSEK